MAIGREDLHFVNNQNIFRFRRVLWCSQRIFWAVRTFNCQWFPVVVIIFYLIVMIKGGWWEVQGGHVNLPWLWKGPCWCSWVEYRGDIYFVRNILRQIVVYCGGVKPWIYDLIFKGTFCVLNFWNVDLQKSNYVQFWGNLREPRKCLLQREQGQPSRRFPHWSHCLLLRRRLVRFFCENFFWGE